MLQWWRNRQQRQQTANALTAATMTAARRPFLYTDYGISDTFDGRFDSLILHAAPIFTHLQSQNLPDLAQAYFDVMFKHMEISLREIGVGDLGVPRHVKNMMMAAQGRCLAYGTALRNNDSKALEAVISRNVFATVPCTPPQLNALTTYVQDIYMQILQCDLRTTDFIYPEGEREWPKAA